jgi:endogenous inhibitor of DNA gyrase (YacG/DUF329 family)
MIINKYYCPACITSVELENVKHLRNISNEFFQFDCPHCKYQIVRNSKHEILKKLQINHIDTFSNQDEINELIGEDQFEC